MQGKVNALCLSGLIGLSSLTAVRLFAIKSNLQPVYLEKLLVRLQYECF